MQINPARGAVINPLHPLSRGLICRWLMNELTGNKLWDYSGNNHIGTIGNATMGSNAKGGCVNFTSANSVITTTGISIPINGTCSFSAWYYFSSIASVLGRYCLIFGSTFQHWANNFLYEYDNDFLAYAFAANTMYHIGMSWSGNATTKKLYVNGNFACNISVQGDVDLVPAFAGNIGGSGISFVGSVGNVAMYNRVLSAAEFNQLYREPFAGFK